MEVGAAAPAAARVAAPAGTQSRGIAGGKRTEPEQLLAFLAHCPTDPRALGSARQAPPTPQVSQCALSAGSRRRGGSESSVPHAAESAVLALPGRAVQGAGVARIGNVCFMWVRSGEEMQFCK